MSLSQDIPQSTEQDILQSTEQDVLQGVAQDTHNIKDLALSQLDGGQATPPVLKASLEEISAFLISDFPQISCTVLAIGVNSATIRYPVDYSSLRPGGTVSGPVMMAAADVALYVALLAQIGIVPLAVTTNLNISFLRKPSAGKDLIVKVELLKVGRRLAMGEVRIYSEGHDELVAHATGTYAIP